MTEEPAGHPEAEIIEKIMSDAELQAKKLVENAEHAVAAEEQKTQREIREVEQDVRAGWDAKVERIRTREMSTAAIESRRTMLAAREQAVEKILGEITKGLAHLREDPRRYRESLRGLAAEAVTAVGGDEVVLKFSERDGGIVDDAFLEQVRTEVNTVSGSCPQLEAVFDSGDNGGGCVAQSPDGRIVLDNTFSRRLERMVPEFRALIVKGLARHAE